MEDYKTLATGTFLNDVIINFYLKYLQYTVLSETDKYRKLPCRRISKPDREKISVGIWQAG